MNEDLLPVLDYSSIKYNPIKREGDSAIGMPESVASLVCGAVPIIGLMTQNILLIFIGFGICSWVGLILGICGTILGRRNWKAVTMGTIGTLVSGLATLVLFQVCRYGFPC